MIKAIFFDIDGTLFSHNTNTIPESTQKALKALQQKGILIFIASGRHIHEMNQLPLTNIRFDGYITLNGQLCFNKHKEAFWGNVMKLRSADSLIHIFQEQRFPILLIEKNRFYINYINDYVLQAHKAVSLRPPMVDSYDGAPIYQAIAYIDTTEEALLSEELWGCRLTRWNYNGIDIIPENGSKALGIQKTLEHFQLKPSEIMAFGDGENDMEMLQFAQIGVAMGNGNAALKNAADYVTSDIDDDGIWNALKKYKIL